MQGQNPPHDILIYTGTERQIDLVSNTGAAPGRIALFHLDDGANDVGVGPFGSGLGPLLWRKQKLILSPDQRPMEIQQCRRLKRNGRTSQTRRLYKQSAEPGDESIPNPQIGCTAMAAIQNQ